MIAVNIWCLMVVIAIAAYIISTHLRDIAEAVNCRHDNLTGDDGKPVPFNEVKFANGGTVPAPGCVEVNWTPDTAAPTPDKQYQPIRVHGIPRSDVCPVCIHKQQPTLYEALQRIDTLKLLLENRQRWIHRQHVTRSFADCDNPFCADVRTALKG